MRLIVYVLILLGVSHHAAMADRTTAPEGAEVYFIAPASGATVKSPVLIQFGLRNMGVAPAGIDHPKTGHHHLLIDVPTPKGEDLDFSLPKDENHRHFGGGETETTIELSPGQHTLQLFLGDKDHIPHATPVTSQTITIEVVE